MRRWSIMSLTRQSLSPMPKLGPQSGVDDSSVGFVQSLWGWLETIGASAFRAATTQRRRRVGNASAVLVASCLALLLLGGCSPSQLIRPDPVSADAESLGQGSVSQRSTDADLYPGADLAARYRIGPQDVLDISVLKEEDLSGRLVVGPDGWIAFPMAGQIRAAGKTVAELQQEISLRLKDTIRDPEVSVTIAEPAGYQVYVVGKVSKPGQFVVGQQVDVLQALAMAGGLTPFANQKAIKVLRQGSIGGKADRIFPFDYGSIKRGRNLGQNIVLQSGDVVVVP